MCSYHGWEFDGSGSCTRIPQSDSPKAEETACSSRRSCATRHPSQVPAASSPPPLIKEGGAPSPLPSPPSHCFPAQSPTIRLPQSFCLFLLVFVTQFWLLLETVLPLPHVAPAVS